MSPKLSRMFSLHTLLDTMVFGCIPLFLGGLATIACAFLSRNFHFFIVGLVLVSIGFLAQPYASHLREKQQLKIRNFIHDHESASE